MKNTLELKITAYLQSKNFIDVSMDYFNKTFEMYGCIDDIIGDYWEDYTTFCEKYKLKYTKHNKKLFEKIYEKQHEKLYKIWLVKHKKQKLNGDFT